MMTHVIQARVTGKHRLAEDTWSLQFRAPEIARVAKPGQFVMLAPAAFPGEVDPITPRPYSIYGLLYEGGEAVGFSLIIKILGRGGAAICASDAGDVLHCTGPLGNSLEIEDGRKYLMVAGGTGIAPVSFAAQLMQRENIEYEILYGGRDAAAVHLDELKRYGLSADPATEDGSLGFHGLVTDQMVDKLRNSGDEIVVFACGPWNMMRAATAACEHLGVQCYCSLERYMACGFGVCLACIYKKVNDPEYHTCCKEGPVVVGREVDWDA